MTASGRLVVGLVLALAVLPLAHAAEFTCTSSQDPATGAFIGDVQCLIAAVSAANLTAEADTIVLAVGTYTLTMATNPSAGLNATGLPLISTPITIRGTRGTTTGGGVGNAFNNGTIITRDVNLGLSRVFRVLEVQSTGDLTLQNIIVRGGLAQFGGGIRNSGMLRLSQSEVSSNTGLLAGGIHNAGTLVLNNSIVRANRALTFSTVIPTLPNPKGFAGGIFNASTGTVELLSSAIGDTTALANGNTAEISGGGLMNDRGLVTINNSSFGFNGAASVNGFGGGMWNIGGIVQLTKSGFAQNLGFNGGAIANTSSGQIRLCTCPITANTGFKGGGIYNDTGGRITFGGTSCASTDFSFFMNNQARNPATGAVGEGGAIWNGSSSTVTLGPFTSFANNTPNNCVNVPGCPLP